jgi:hypothetical protein
LSISVDAAQASEGNMEQRTWFISGVNSGFGRVMTEQLVGERLLCKFDRELLTFCGFISFLFIYNNLGHLLFAQD